MTDRKDILETAIGLTCGDRDKDYGSPVPNMDHIAAMMTAYLGDRLKEPLTGADAAWFQVLVKASRCKTSPTKRDNYDDAAAYVGIAGECAMMETELRT
ncbi:MAG: DUF6378 domain-containing protein [Pseudomonadota bacterium]